MKGPIHMALTKVTELGKFIRDQRTNARISLRKLSNMAGISNPYLSQIERGMRRPSAEILQAIAKSLRISAETLYVKAGILEERSADHEVDPVTAILRDLTITEKQKQVLIEIYTSFKHENELEGSGRPAKLAQARGTSNAKGGAAKKRRAPAKRSSAKRAKPKRAASRARTAAAGKAPARKRTTAKRATSSRAKKSRAAQRTRARARTG